MIVNKKYRSEVCLNCNHPLDISDKYCCNCGQLNSKKRLSLKDFINEFLSNFYAYDSRIRKTFVSLFLKPGKAALDFIEGKRQTYVNPFRFYLSVSIIYFLLFGFVNNYESLENPNFVSKPEKDRGSIIQINDGNSENNNDSIKIPVKIYTEKELAQFGFLEALENKVESFSEFYEKHPNLSISESLDSLQYEKTKMNQYIFKKTIDSEEMFGKNQNFKTFQDYMLSKLPLIFFISLPFLTLAFSLVYIRKKMNYAEHLVFVFSTMSFVFILKIIDTTAQLTLNLNPSFILNVGLFFYFYKSLRNFYQQSRLKTIFKFVILSIILMTLAVIAVLISMISVFLTF
uniref:DUF3667 domain-containing protein n=1 Tax=Flavobacterium sp. TaxID=239 RepID=UPI00404A2949